MLDETTGSTMNDVVMFSGGGYGAPRDFQSQLAALDEEYRQRREAIARELLNSLMARESVLVDELRDVRAQKDEIVKQTGIAPELPAGRELFRPIVRRRRIDDKTAFDAVQIERIPAKPTAAQSPMPTKVQDAILHVLGTAENMTRHEIADAVELFWPGKYQRSTVETSVCVMAKDYIIGNEPSKRTGDHRLTKVYSLQKGGA